MLSKHLALHEVVCKCGCGFGTHPDHIDPNLPVLFEKIRSLAGGNPLIINSGCRCPEYNSRIGGAKKSAHMMGAALDIACHDSELRYRLNRAAMIAGCRRIGLAKTFVHVDTAHKHRPSPRNWLY